jgi:hypothetical protein
VRTRDGGETFVLTADRIAVFDNDGTLSTENTYTQLAFALDRMGSSLGSVSFQVGDDGPELMKDTDLAVLDDGLGAELIHRGHVGLDRAGRPVRRSEVTLERFSERQQVENRNYA